MNKSLEKSTFLSESSWDLPQLRSRAEVASKFCLVATGFFAPVSISVTNILLVLTIAFSLLAGNIKEKFHLALSNRVMQAALLFFFLFVISLSYSSGTWADMANALRKYDKLLYLLFLLPLFNHARYQRYAINAFLLGMVVTLVGSFFKMWGWISSLDPDPGHVFTNHINTGFFLAFTTFVLAHRCCVANKWRWLYLVLLLLFSYNIFFMNEGRTGYVLFLALFSVFLWQKWGWKGLLIAEVIAPLTLLLVFALSGTFKDRIEMIANDLQHYHQQQLNGNSIGLRMVFSKNSVELIKNHPLIGTGAGSFRVEYNSRFPTAPGFANLSNPQNEYLMILVQLGVVGLLGFLFLFYVQWRSSFALPTEIQYLAQGLVVAFMVGSLCDTFLFLAYTGYFFVYCSALVFAHNEKK